MKQRGLLLARRRHFNQTPANDQAAQAGHGLIAGPVYFWSSWYQK
jgi:hypothetical protein